MSDKHALSGRAPEVEGVRRRTTRIALPDGASVGAIITGPASDEPQSCFVLAHGAGAGMTHPFLEAVAHGLAQLAVATLRYQFPAMERGSRRPDQPATAQAAVRAAVAAAHREFAGLPLFAGGKSFGGRMTSQAQSRAPMQGVEGLIFLGYPLHPAGRPSIERAHHLEQVEVPMLFVHGTHDALALPQPWAVLRRRHTGLANLVEVDQADHSFHVPRRTGKTDAETLAEMVERVWAWTQAWQLGPPGRGS